MIKSVIKSETLGTVLVFDEKGKQMAEYQGQYEVVRERILRDALPGTLFYYDNGRRLKAVGREEW